MMLLYWRQFIALYLTSMTSDAHLLWTVHCGMREEFHSLRVFMSLCCDVPSISNPSLICRNVESRWNVPVMSIRNWTLFPWCSFSQWLCSGELAFLLWYISKCSFPLVYALYDVSLRYTSFLPQLSVHVMKESNSDFFFQINRCTIYFYW